MLSKIYMKLWNSVKSSSSSRLEKSIKLVLVHINSFSKAKYEEIEIMKIYSYLNNGFWWGSPRFKKSEIIISIFFIKSRRFAGLFPPSSGFRKVNTRNSAENEKMYNIVSATERKDRGEWDILFPSLTFQNPEERGNEPPKRRLWIKKIDIIISLFFF